MQMNLIDQAKPGSHISEVLRCGELRWPRCISYMGDCVACYFKACKFYIVFCKAEFFEFRIMPFLSHMSRQFSASKKQSLMITAYSKDFIDAFGFGWKCCGNLIVHSGVSNSRGYVALWGCAIPITPLWCNESYVVAVIGMERDTVISIPHVKYCFLLSTEDISSWWKGDLERLVNLVI